MDTISQDLVLHLPLSAQRASRLEHVVRFDNGNVAMNDSCAQFNGKNASLTLQLDPQIKLFERDFSLFARIRTDQELDGVIGDIASSFDPTCRRGVNLSVKHHAGAVTSQTNYRNLHFEADDGTEPEWHDLGRVGNAVAVWSLAVHQGRLYAGTYEEKFDEAGRVYRYVGGQGWKCTGPLDASNTVSALAVHDDQLYAATKTDDPHGSLLEPSKNSRPGGNVFRLNSDDTWTHCGQVCDQDNLFGLSTFRGNLFAWPAYAKGVYCYRGGEIWDRIPSPNSRLLAMAPYHGAMYATANRLALLDPNVTHAGPHGDPSVQPIVGKEGAFALRNGKGWEGCGNQGQETQIYSIGIHGGKMYAGTWPSGKVFRYDGDQLWHDCGRLGSEDEVMGLAVYNGMLYAGTLPTASIYRYDGDGRWTNIGQADTTPGVPLRRAINMAVYRGQLCVGTLPSGHVRAIEVGQVASHDFSLPAGWHSIAAVRRQGVLFLYLDGHQVAQSRPMSQEMHLGTNQPLQIGFGRHDYFNGHMRDFRAYARALSPAEITRLSDPTMG